jgi:hypothetical protein
MTIDEQDIDLSLAVNEPVEPEKATWYEVLPRTPWGVKTLVIRRDDFVRYQKDPDAFAAEHFGISKADYRAWIAHEGVAYCGARTAAGRACRNVLSGAQTEAREWKRLHRSYYCKTHGGDQDERC